MNENVKIEEVTEVQEVKKEPPKNMTVEDIINNYPTDREKVRDVIMVDISKNLLKIATSMEAIPQALLGITQKLENLDKRRVGGPG